mmetsp:Transcript_76958/g.138864  ORF Transcript_76958/g.138864 Transcript_76958/m.138864 type:complete len:203 (+) Transcript_76958:833-1441(+)
MAQRRKRARLVQAPPARRRSAEVPSWQGTGAPWPWELAAALGPRARKPLRRLRLRWAAPWEAVQPGRLAPPAEHRGELRPPVDCTREAAPSPWDCLPDSRLELARCAWALQQPQAGGWAVTAAELEDRPVPCCLAQQRAQTPSASILENRSADRAAKLVAHVARAQPLRVLEERSALLLCWTWLRPLGTTWPQEPPTRQCSE